jgi:glucosyl-3-phosphoglycerate synthase
VLPVHERDLDKDALKGILVELRKVDYLHEVVVALTCKDRKTYRRAVRMFKGLPAETMVLWCESPEVRGIYEDLQPHGIDLDRFAGKGIAVWLGIGAAAVDNYAIACHDADIESYSPRLLSSLLLPVIDPDLDFFFTKGYYARLTGDQLYGRVARLFVAPFLEAVNQHLGRRSPYLRYLRAFRYPLSGEFAMTSDLAMNIRVPTDWGLEMGLLAEVYRNASPKRICQVDLGLYSHKHQAVGTKPSEGLQRMAGDICSTVLRTLTENEGQEVSPSTLLALRVMYQRSAQDYVRRYFVDAKVNGLSYDRHREEQLIEVFARIIQDAGAGYLEHPTRAQVPDWLRVLSAGPATQQRVRGAAIPRTVREELRDAALRGAKEAT